MGGLLYREFAMPSWNMKPQRTKIREMIPITTYTYVVLKIYSIIIRADSTVPEYVFLDAMCLGTEGTGERGGWDPIH